MNTPLFIIAQDGTKINVALMRDWVVDDSGSQPNVSAIMHDNTVDIIWEDTLENCEVIYKYLYDELVRDGLDFTNSNTVLSMDGVIIVDDPDE